MITKAELIKLFDERLPGRIYATGDRPNQVVDELMSELDYSSIETISELHELLVRTMHLYEQKYSHRHSSELRTNHSCVGVVRSCMSLDRRGQLSHNDRGIL